MLSSNPDSTKKCKIPPLIKHYTHNQETNGTCYSLGDTKVWNNATYYFCYCLTHNKMLWHTHKPKDCCTHFHWLVKNKEKDKINNEAKALTGNSNTNNTPAEDKEHNVPMTAICDKDLISLLSYVLIRTL